MTITRALIQKALLPAGITPLQLANELLSATQEKYKPGERCDPPVTRSYSYGDDVFTFKIEGNFAQCLYMYVSDDDGKTWTQLFEWSDH